MAKNKTLESAVAKLTRAGGKINFGGFVTPAEGLALIDAGCKPDNPGKRQYYLEKIKQGSEDKNWTYFSIPANIRKMINCLKN